MFILFDLIIKLIKLHMSCYSLRQLITQVSDTLNTRTSLLSLHMTRGTTRYSFRSNSIFTTLYINDLPSVISSKVRLFADDCLVYREIKSSQDQNDLQKDLNLLETWGSTWGMRFNAAKCNIMRVSRKQTPIPYQYELSGQVLEEVKDAKYLWVTVSYDLEWTKHIDVITSKANSKLSFLRRNLKGCPEKLRETAYFSLVRSFLEYSATVWHPRQNTTLINWRWCSAGLLAL